MLAEVYWGFVFWSKSC